MFAELELRDWRQFASLKLQFHSRLTIITGANGAGKTTVLNLLSRHVGWGINLISTPRLTRKGALRYLSGRWPQLDDDSANQQHEIGRIVYSDGQVATISVQDEVGVQFHVTIQGQQNLTGLFIPSHRPPYTYAPVTSIPTQVRARDQIIQQYVSDLMQRFNPNATVRSPSFRLKESLISLSTFGYGSERVERNDAMVETLEGFETILKAVLPAGLQFERLLIRVPEVILSTRTGDVSLDAVSGGIASIIDLAWQLHMRALLHDKFVVLIDEPENHLHPSLQRSLFRDFLKAFPQAQFIVASHNPFIVTSVPESHIYVLDYGADGMVASKMLDMVNRAGSSDDVLREVLGVETTIPIWVEDKLAALVDEFGDRPFTEDSLTELRERLRFIGMGDVFPEAIARLVDRP